MAFVTVGDTDRHTGGYLYHAYVFAGLRKEGIEVEEYVASGASPEEQRRAMSNLGYRFDPRHFEVIVVDALARIVCGPWLDRWREACPILAMVHELPSVTARTGYEVVLEHRFEEPLLRADRLITVSNHGRFLLQSRGVPSERIHVVPPGFDRLSLLEVGECSTVRNETVVRVLCVAQLIPRKGILDLVRAWVARERPGAMLELIGETDADPTYATSVRAAIMGSSSASITLSGPVDDAELKAAYAAADLFALPSRYEGYGIVYAEALAYGLPVIACDVGPIPELVGRDAAILVPPGDTEALSGALDLLLEDPVRQSRMSASARRRAHQLPRWKDTIARFWQVLEEVLASTDSRRPL